MEHCSDSHNPEHEPRRIDLAKHIRHMDGVAVGALRGGWERIAMQIQPLDLLFALVAVTVTCCTGVVLGTLNGYTNIKRISARVPPLRPVKCTGAN